jgi:YD repeat-containing protein
VTRFVYDQHHNLTELRDTADQVTRITWDAKQHLRTITRPGGTETVLVYDAVGLLTRLVVPEGNVTHFTYDAAGRLVEVVDAKGAAYHFEYDPSDRLIGMTTPLGGQMAFAYDSRGRLLSATALDGGHPGRSAADWRGTLTLQHRGRPSQSLGGGEVTRIRSSPFFPVQCASGRGTSPGAPVHGAQGSRPQGGARLNDGWKARRGCGSPARHGVLPQRSRPRRRTAQTTVMTLAVSQRGGMTVVRRRASSQARAARGDVRPQGR